MKAKGPRLALIFGAIFGMLAISAPWLITEGLTWETLRLICVNLGTGIIASVIVIGLTRYLANSEPMISSSNDLIECLRGDFSYVHPQILAEFEENMVLGQQLRKLGVEAVFESRELAYGDIAKEIRAAKKVFIATGSLHSFWSLYRELLIEKQHTGSCEIKIAIMNPGSTHATVRAAMDTGIMPSTNIFEGYVATIKQIKEEIHGCRLYDFCPPASVWLIDEVAYVTPYFYAIRGGQGLCIKINRSDSRIFENLVNSIQRLFADIDEVPKK